MAVVSIKIFSLLLCSTLTRSSIAAGLLDQIRVGFGEERASAIEARAAALKHVVLPTVTALPKTELGYLGEAAARYALHRLFVQHRGWFVKGLMDQSGHITDILQEQVPGSLKTVVNSLLLERGLSLDEVALIGGLLEDAVQFDMLSHARAAYKALDLSLDGQISNADVDDVLSYVMKRNILAAGGYDSSESKEYLEDELPFEDVYPNWPDLENYLRQTRRVVAPAEHGTLSFDDITHILEELGEHYGQWAGQECTRQRDNLVKLEDQCPGYVDLSVFYGSNLVDGQWQFAESVDYLRSLGALDESQPEHHKVIVSNYVLGGSNCVGTSRYYSQCCVDPCDGFLAKLEKSLVTPEPTVAQVVDAVQRLLPPIQGNKVAMPVALKRRLEEISLTNRGTVPLHGRLFAQWLHHAYPRECPVPTAVGETVRPEELPFAFSKRTGKNFEVSEKEIRQYIKSHQSKESLKRLRVQRKQKLKQCSIPWSSEEELPLSAKAPSTLAPFVSRMQPLHPFGQKVGLPGIKVQPLHPFGQKVEVALLEDEGSPDVLFVSKIQPLHPFGHKVELASLEAEGASSQQTVVLTDSSQTRLDSPVEINSLLLASALAVIAASLLVASLALLHYRASRGAVRSVDLQNGSARTLPGPLLEA